MELHLAPNADLDVLDIACILYGEIKSWAMKLDIQNILVLGLF